MAPKNKVKKRRSNKSETPKSKNMQHETEDVRTADPVPAGTSQARRSIPLKLRVRQALPVPPDGPSIKRTDQPSANISQVEVANRLATMFSNALSSGCSQSFHLDADASAISEVPGRYTSKRRREPSASEAYTAQAVIKRPRRNEAAPEHGEVAVQVEGSEAAPIARVQEDVVDSDAAPIDRDDGEVVKPKTARDVLMNFTVNVVGGPYRTVQQALSLDTIFAIIKKEYIPDDGVQALSKLFVYLETTTCNQSLSEFPIAHIGDSCVFRWLMRLDKNAMKFCNDLILGALRNGDTRPQALQKVLYHPTASKDCKDYCRFLEMQFNQREEPGPKWYNKDHYIIPVCGQNHWSVVVMVDLNLFMRKAREMVDAKEEHGESVPLRTICCVLKLDSCSEQSPHSTYCDFGELLKMVFFYAVCPSVTPTDEYEENLLRNVSPCTILSVSQETTKDCGFYTGYNVQIAIGIVGHLANREVVLADFDNNFNYDVLRRNLLSLSRYQEITNRYIGYILNKVETYISKKESTGDSCRVELPTSLSHVMDLPDFTTSELTRTFVRIKNIVQHKYGGRLTKRLCRQRNEESIQKEFKHLSKGVMFSLPKDRHAEFKRICRSLFSSKKTAIMAERDNHPERQRIFTGLLQTALATCPNVSHEEHVSFQNDVRQAGDQFPRHFPEELRTFLHSNLENKDVFEAFQKYRSF